MLSEEVRREIEHEIQVYGRKQAACIDALRIVQRERGWVNDEAIRDLAPVLDMTPGEIDGVATFYNGIYRRPVGRHVILLCDSISCWVMGYENIREQLHARLGIGMGETTADGRFTLLPIVCLGSCEKAPCMTIDGEVYGNLNAERIQEALAKYA